jgi:hypothetical protein
MRLIAAVKQILSRLALLNNPPVKQSAHIPRTTSRRPSANQHQPDAWHSR